MQPSNIVRFGFYAAMIAAMLITALQLVWAGEVFYGSIGSAGVAAAAGGGGGADNSVNDLYAISTKSNTICLQEEHQCTQKVLTDLIGRGFEPGAAKKMLQDATNQCTTRQACSINISTTCCRLTVLAYNQKTSWHSTWVCQPCDTSCCDDEYGINGPGRNPKFPDESICSCIIAVTAPLTDDEISTLEPACKQHQTRITSPQSGRELSQTFRFMNAHNISHALCCGSLLGESRFGLLASPWDDDVDVGTYFETHWALFNRGVGAIELQPGYRDVTSTQQGRDIMCYQDNSPRGPQRLRNCQLSASSNPVQCNCSAWITATTLVIELPVVDSKTNCLVFASHSTKQMIQVFFHEECSSKPHMKRKVIDIFSVVCKTEGSEACTRGQHLAQDAGRFRPFELNKKPKVSFAAVDWRTLLKLTPTHVPVMNGALSASIPPREVAHKVLSMNFGPYWRTMVVICPHSKFGDFRGSCLERPPRHMEILQKGFRAGRVPSCQAVMEFATEPTGS